MAGTSDWTHDYQVLSPFGPLKYQKAAVKPDVHTHIMLHIALLPCQNNFNDFFDQKPPVGAIYSPENQWPGLVTGLMTN